MTNLKFWRKFQWNCKPINTYTAEVSGRPRSSKGNYLLRTKDGLAANIEHPQNRDSIMSEVTRSTTLVLHVHNL
jgi:hypothetical protein